MFPRQREGLSGNTVGREFGPKYRILHVFTAHIVLIVLQSFQQKSIRQLERGIHQFNAFPKIKFFIFIVPVA